MPAGMDISPHLASKILQAHVVVSEALNAHLDDKELVAVAVLFSGGNDSTTLAHLFRDVADVAIHCNTTIGVEATRQFVRDTCRDFGLPLMEELPPVSFAELVCEQGFPGPAHHFKAYQRLKERSLRQARRKLVTNGRKQRVLFLAGRRRDESARRAGVPAYEREDSVIWASPFADWTKEDLTEYRATFDVPRNPVADRLGMSGECLCGAFAEPGEYERIAAVDPAVAQQILEMEEAALAAGVAPQRCQWGWGAYRSDPGSQPSKVGPLCSSCDDRFQVARQAEHEHSPELAAVLAKRRARA